MFTKLSQLIPEGNSLHINVMKTNGKLAVLVVPQSGNVKDQAIENLIPLMLNGTPEELDAGFFSAIYNPVMKATGLISNIAAFEKAMEKTASNSKVEKDKNEAVNKLVKDAEALEKENKFTEALTIYKKAFELDKNNTKLQLKVITLKQKTGQIDMFSNVSDISVADPVNTPAQTEYPQVGTQLNKIQKQGTDVPEGQPSMQYQPEYSQTNPGNTGNILQSGNEGSQQSLPFVQQQNPEFLDNNPNPGNYYPDNHHQIYNNQPNENRPQPDNTVDLFEAVLNS